MNETEHWEVNALNQIPGLCAEIKRLSDENDRLKSAIRDREKNEPLTLDELKKMDGQPVWAGNDKEPDNFEWFLVSLCGYGRDPVTLLNENNNLMHPFMKSVEHPDGWTAYRHPLNGQEPGRNV